jgi:alpha-1,6-mannosyltransferase
VSRIAQVANFVGPHSGGIRTVLNRLADGYAAAGHEVLQVVPGVRSECTTHAWGVRVELPGLVLPGTGYRVITAGAVARLLGELEPDRLEVHDRTTLRSLGSWARRRDVASCVVSHERLDRLLAQWLSGRIPTERIADLSNRRLAAGFDAVVCTTAWAASEFERLPIVNLQVIPLGVDVDRFTPHAGNAGLRARLAPPGAVLLAMASRLSREKQPGIAIAATRELVRRGVAVTLAVAGDGPLRHRLESDAGDLPIHFVGHLSSTAEVAALLATADVVLAPGPVETFGLAALEALACGTPVVVNSRSALPEVIGRDAGVAAKATAPAFADAVQQLLSRPEPARAESARARAVGYDWATTVAGFLAAHQLGDLRSVIG